jgi:hypothetical protein
MALCANINEECMQSLDQASRIVALNCVACVIDLHPTSLGKLAREPPRLIIGEDVALSATDH